MSEINKTYRIRTDVGRNSNEKYITLDTNLVQDYDVFDILSVKINSVDTYKLHNANYGVVVGRVLANNGFGVPNAKISIFIPYDTENGERVRELYPFSSTASRNKDGVRYNLLPDEKTSDCHQIVGTFPNKQYALDNDVILEVFDKYYKYTTRTNNSGDYIIMGVPVGTHTLHMDLDLSDCGILSQRPRDFVYKGYTVEQFENPNMFKSGTNYSNLSQIFTQDQVVNVLPFWGNSSLGEKLGITRADIDIAFKFEPTCVFIGSVISDNSSQGISKKCIPTENMGNMEELTTGEGTIEMIRKTPGGSVEEFQIKGTQLIDGNGVWCYQIPMNLDYMMTDEYGNMVPTDNPDIGIPTRTRVRFRISMADNEENVDNYFRAKMLVPHNPQNLDDDTHEEYDYEFGSLTREESFRDLFWNNVYSVKSYIPRFQKRKVGGWKEKKFTGIKSCNFYGSNNPMPYNNIRIKLPFIFTVMCAIIKIFIFVVSIINSLISMYGNFLSDIGDTYIGFKIWKWRIGFYPFKKIYKKSLELSMSVIKEGLCPDLENWFFAPMFRKNLWSPSSQPPKDYPKYDLLKQTLNKIRESSADNDSTSIDIQNNEEKEGEEPICLTIYTDYLISCVEMNLAMEYKVINFDFYNDWINGTLYFPRFMRYVRVKKTFMGSNKIAIKSKIKACMDDTSIFSKTRRYTQQCAIGYKPKNIGGRVTYTAVNNPIKNKKEKKAANNLHKQRGLTQKTIFGVNGGICHEHTTLKGQYVYYMKPCEWDKDTIPYNKKTILYATDIILLGSLNTCDLNGIPQAFKYLSSTSYVMPTNLALTNMESNGYLYATEEGVMCSGKVSLSESDVREGARAATVPPSCGLTAEILAFSGAQDSNYNVQYDGKELSDIIALTEAAGISWNYTGPGQGEENAELMYHPGGHFLGLSCVNSMTNLKSCINLSRICELGVNMSQRKEDISGIDNNGNIKYTYTVPSGFISGDDIVGADFRTMFATMNHKRLLATKINPNTGYKIYDMDFVKPINFDGSFNNVVTASTIYNSKVEIPKEDVTIWEKIGIDFNKDSRPDYDEKEGDNTQTRTNEDVSLDYYLFRFGINYDDATRDNQNHLRKFLVNSNSCLYLPQYENSYYFYFGLKNGATAIDEFNKQFFSECENSILLSNEPILDIVVEGDINICEATADIIVNTMNLETPFQYIEILSDVKFITNESGEKVKGIVIKGSDDETKYDSWLTNYSFKISDCPFGTYVVTIRDANDIIYTKTAKIGLDLVSYNCEVFDFNFNTNNTSEIDGNLIHKGGYVKVKNVLIDKLPFKTEEENGTILTIFIEDEYGKIITEETYENGDVEEITLTVNKPGVYTLKVKYKCENSTSDISFLLQTIKINDTSNLRLYMGVEGVYSKELTLKTHPYGWWNDMGKDDYWVERMATFNEENNRELNSSAIKTYTNGGSKIVWGHPQNNTKIDVTTVASSEDIINAGFTVDDEFYHWPTLKYKTGEVTHFSSIVYNDEMVMGDYVAYFSNGILKFVVDNISKYLKKGCGYVFKPLPNGDLQFHVYNGTSFTFDETVDKNGNKITNGLFYASISYPSVDRAFKVNSNFYCWSRRTIEMISDETGETTPTIMDYEEGGKTEMTIYNGITYDGKFLSGSTDINGSYITNYSGETITVEKDDMSGLGFGNGIDRETKINCFNSKCIFDEYDGKTIILQGASGITSYGYEIIGGVKVYDDINTKITLTESNSLYDVVDSNFGDYITYSIFSSNENEKIVVGPNVEGGSNNTNVEYYLAVDKEGSKLLCKTKQQYVYVKQGNTFYVFSTYTKDATNNIEGGPVIVKVIRDKKKASYSFPYINDSGETTTYNGNLEKNSINKDTSDVDVLNKIFEHAKKVEGIIDYKINKNIGNLEIKLERDKIDGRESKLMEGYNYYAFGVINSDNGTKLYKIYPTIVKVSELKNEEVEDVEGDITLFYNNIEHSKNFEISIGAEKNDFLKFGVDTAADKKWVAESNKDWCVIRSEMPSNLSSCHIAISENIEDGERKCEIGFRYEGSSKYLIKVTIIQNDAKLDI